MGEYKAEYRIKDGIKTLFIKPNIFMRKKDDGKIERVVEVPTLNLINKFKQGG